MRPKLACMHPKLACTRPSFACRTKSNPLRYALRQPDAGRDGRVETVVMADREYDAARTDASYQAVLRYLLQDHVFLFLGYGMNDPLDLALAFKANADDFRSAAQKHYVLLRNPSDGDRDRIERTYNVRVLPYAEHAQVPEILEQLAAGK